MPTVMTRCLVWPSCLVFRIHPLFIVGIKMKTLTTLLVGQAALGTLAFSPQLANPSSLQSRSTVSIGRHASTLQEQEEVVSEEKAAKTYLDDGFVFGLEGSGIDRPKGKVAQIVVEGDSLETQPWQVAVSHRPFLWTMESLPLTTLTSLMDNSLH